jgi:hypothetical protein
VHDGDLHLVGGGREEVVMRTARVSESEAEVYSSGRVWRMMRMPSLS